MKRILYTLLFVFSLVCCLSEASAAKRSSRSETSETKSDGALMYCDTLTHDFGDVERRRSEIEYTFTIENRGDEPLIITRVVRSCSCMKAHISKRPIAVGESREMRVVYEVHKMPEGPFSKVVQIYSTSRDGGFMQFTIMGRSVTKEKSK